MYLEHFGLRELPFSLTPDTSFFFACTSYQEALNTLLVAARNGEGFIKIVGEVGNGKTMLCRKFLATLNADSTAEKVNKNVSVDSCTPVNAKSVNPSQAREKFAIAYIPNPFLEPRSLLLALADEFCIPLDQSIDQHHILKELTRALLQFARDGKRVLVCLDEAQGMPLESMEMLRLLTNLETEKRKLMQVVLFGQPELDARLKQNSIRQLRQRISFQYVLSGLRRDELDRYLRYRLSVAGYKGDTLFKAAAVARLHRVTRGTPRLVNILANKALMLAFGEGRQQVLPRHVGLAAADTPESKQDRRKWLWAAFVVMLSTELIVGWVLMR